MFTNVQNDFLLWVPHPYLCLQLNVLGFMLDKYRATIPRNTVQQVLHLYCKHTTQITGFMNQQHSVQMPLLKITIMHSNIVLKKK